MTSGSEHDLGFAVRRELIEAPIEDECVSHFLRGALAGAGERDPGGKLTLAHSDPSFVRLCEKLVARLTGSSCAVGKRAGKAVLEFPDAASLDSLFPAPSRDPFAIEPNPDFAPDRACPKFYSDARPARSGESRAARELAVSSASGKAYLRGLFLACGTVRIPGGKHAGESSGGAGYAISLRPRRLDVAELATRLISRLALVDERLIKLRRGACAVIKNSEAVCNVLAALGSMSGALTAYSVIAERQALNDANRARNCDIANIDRTLKAVDAALDAIRSLKETGAYAELCSDLKKTCDLREKHPDASLAELGKKFSPEIGKSCVNHRLRRIRAIASSMASRKV